MKNIKDDIKKALDKKLHSNYAKHIGFDELDELKRLKKLLNLEK